MAPPPIGLFQQPWPEGSYRLFQLGFVVDDVMAAANRWVDTFGVGPFHVLPPIDVSCTYRGAPSGMTVQVALAQAGPVQVELIQQHCDRASVYRDLATAGAAGFHQVCTVTRGYDAMTAHYEALGFELACDVTTPTGQRVAYFDTVDAFGFFTEIAEEVPGFLEQLAAIAHTCATWDGTDPIRLLTRNGYRTP